jgi:hypothetical protein
MDVWIQTISFFHTMLSFSKTEFFCSKGKLGKQCVKGVFKNDFREKTHGWKNFCTSEHRKACHLSRS